MISRSNIEEKIEDIISSIQFPKSVFVSVSASSDSVLFDKVEDDSSLLSEDMDFLTRMVVSSAISCTKEEVRGDKIVREVDKKRILGHIQYDVKNFYIKLWEFANSSKKFRRTKFSKTFYYAFAKDGLSSKFFYDCLELYIDAHKYGVDLASMNHGRSITDLHKFISAKFQAMAEAQ